MNAEEIVKALDRMSVDGDEAILIADALKGAFGRHQLKAKLSLRKGMIVSWNGRNHGEMQGQVIKVNRKTIDVRANDVTWRVSPSLLKVVG